MLGLAVRCATERVIVRLLIQTGRPPAQLHAADLDELAAALHRRTQANGAPTACAADRAMISTTHRVLLHLGTSRRRTPDHRRDHRAARRAAPNRMGSEPGQMAGLLR
ncbi:MAG: hypothetical protein ACRDRK_16620 [Pseudonocardia sp.]